MNGNFLDMGVSTLLSPYGVSSLYHCKMERLILMSSLLHRWTGKVLCHSEIIETAISTDLTSGQCERNKYSIKALQACMYLGCPTLVRSLMCKFAVMVKVSKWFCV